MGMLLMLILESLWTSGSQHFSSESKIRTLKPTSVKGMMDSF